MGGRREVSQSKCPLGWDPVAAGNRAGDGMACNDSDRRQWRMQEAVVGAAASKTQAMRGGCWEPQSELVSEEKAADGSS